MKLNQLTEKIQIESSNADFDADISSICYDSRKAVPGCVFVAIKGFESDGNKFIPSALEKGASVIVCEDIPEYECIYVQVKDCRFALALLSAAFYNYPAEQMKIIGVTGTSGKTTTTHLIKHVIENTLNCKVGLIGTNGNLIGDEVFHTEYTTPDSLELQHLFRQMADSGCEYVVMEVSSHSLFLKRVAGFDFDVAAFTNLSRDHLDFHKTMDEYAKAKKIIFSHCRNACINADDSYSDVMLEGIEAPVVTTSAERNDADICAKDIRLNAKGVRFAVVSSDGIAPIRLGIPGFFSVYNALTVISVCRCLGIPDRDIAAALESAKGVKGRVETVPGPEEYTVIIDYSHKPDALEKVLKTLKPVTEGKLVCLFGCGGDRDRTKRPVMAKIAADNSDFVIVTSDNPRTEDPMAIIEEILPGLEGTSTPYKVIPDRIEAICWSLDNASAGDVILLAGKGHEDYQIIGHEKHHMDEREIVANHLNNRN